MQKQYDAVRSFLLAAASCQKPDTATYQNLVAEVGNTIASVQKAKEAHRRDAKWFSYLTMIGEGAQGVAWIVSVRIPPFIPFLDLRSADECVEQAHARNRRI